MAKRKAKVPTGAILTKFLRLISQDIHTVDDNADIVTKAEALSALIWKYALGFWEKNEDDPGIQTWVKPDFRAINLLYDRIEGKVQAAAPEESGLTLPEKVSNLAQSRVNSMAEATQPEPKKE